MANLYYRVHEEAVQSFIRPGGAVNDLVNDVAQGTFHFSQKYIGKGHVRSGRLLGGLFWNRAKLDGPLRATALAGSSARHTRYFHDGTGYIIHPKMIVPIIIGTPHNNPAFKGAGSEALASNKKSTRRKDQVRGQSSKPFLQLGLAHSMAAQSLS